MARLPNRVKHNIEVKLRLRMIKDREIIRAVLALMRRINSAANKLSKLARKQRIYSYDGMSYRFMPYLRETLGLTVMDADMVIEKVARAYRAEKKILSHTKRYHWELKPLRFERWSPIYIRQMYMTFRERCDLHLPGTGHHRIDAEFGRYHHTDFKKGRTYMAGTAELRYYFKGQFTMTMEVEIPDGFEMVENALGIDRGFITVMYPPQGLHQKIRERRDAQIQKGLIPRGAVHRKPDITLNGQPVEAHPVVNEN